MNPVFPTTDSRQPQRFGANDPFDGDPFVAAETGCAPRKPVVEIVQSLGGYCKNEPASQPTQVVLIESSRQETNENSSTKTPFSRNDSLTSANHGIPNERSSSTPVATKGASKVSVAAPTIPSKKVRTAQLELKSLTPRFTVTSIQQAEHRLGSTSLEFVSPVKCNSHQREDSQVVATDRRDKKSTLWTAHPVVNEPVAEQVLNPARKETPSRAQGSAANSIQDKTSCRYIAQATINDEIPVDIRDFIAAPTSNETQHPVMPEPIRESYQFEPQFFEHHPTLRHLDQLETLDRELTQLLSTETPAPAPSAAMQTQSAVTSADTQPSSGTDNADFADSGEIVDEMAGVIYAQDRQVIYVDGKEGYQYIDLSCFDIKQASFQGNRIRVRNGVQEFEIDYQNITHVLFANGQEVELAIADEDYL